MNYKINKKGFTLIELLAVILILGIIALIAIPTINNAIDSSKKGVKENTAKEMISAAEDYCSTSKLSGAEVYKDLTLYQSTGEEIKDLLNLKGDLPTYEDIVTYEFDNDCNVKLVYETEMYACSNLEDENGNVVYDDKDSFKISSKVTCKKVNNSILTGSNNNLVTNGVKHTLKSYYDYENNEMINTDFRSEQYIDTIYKIEFTNTDEVPSDAIASFDLSDAEDKSIMGWILPVESGSSWNVLYIGSKGTIYANPNSYGWFSNMTNLTSISFGNYKTDNVTDMSRMFYYDISLSRLDIRVFNTSKVESFFEMFAGNYKNKMIIEEIKGIEKIDVSKATDLGGMFIWNYQIKSLDLSRWNTSNVTDMSGMFACMESLEYLNISTWNTSNVIDMSWMFEDVRLIKKLDIKNFDTSKVTDMSGMFSDMESLTSFDLSNFDTSNVTDMSDMFVCMRNLEYLNVSTWNTSNVTDMSWMFFGNSNLTNLNIGNFDTSNVTDMSWMFAWDMGLISLNLSNFDTSKVTNMEGMFFDVSNITTLDLSNFNTSNVTNMSYMFAGAYFATATGESYYNFNIIKSVIGLENFDTSNVTDMSNMFRGNSGFESLDLSNWNVSKVTTTAGMFQGCKNLKKIDLSNWNTVSLNNMSSMFMGHYGGNEQYSFYSPFEEIVGLSKLNTSNVTNMTHMFYRGGVMPTLDLSGWNTRNVTKMQHMFRANKTVTTIYVGDNWSVDKVTDGETMFAYSPNLKGAITYSLDKTSKEYANTTTGYLTYKEN